MELTLWTYEGPPHVGAMRIATSMEGVHYVLHAPQGDTYADLLFTMIERRDRRPPVTYTTFQARDLGGDTAELVQRSIQQARNRAFEDVFDGRVPGLSRREVSVGAGLVAALLVGGGDRDVADRAVGVAGDDRALRG